MRHRTFAKRVPTIIALACLLFSAVSLSGTALGASGKGREPLEMYTATVTRPQAAKLARDVDGSGRRRRNEVQKAIEAEDQEHESQKDSGD